MGFHYLDLDSLSAHSGLAVEELKQKSYSELESMIIDMNRSKFMDQNKRNAQSAEYERLVLKYFGPVNMLKHWFDSREIVLACANTGITERDLCEEYLMPPGLKCPYNNAEYIRTSVESVRQYTKDGQELMEPKQELRDVYRNANRYQSTRQGDVILKMLYGHYPELAEFEFKAYGTDYERVYEIYPKNNIYTPFAALMSGNVDAVIFRNREYCKFYNNGRFSPEECEKAFQKEDARKLFDAIRKVGESERAAGHSVVSRDEDGNLVSVCGLVQTKQTDGVVLLNEKPDNTARRARGKERFMLYLETPLTVQQLTEKFMDMVGDTVQVDIHVYHKEDYLGEHGINLSADSASFTDDFGFDCSDFIVENTFGWCVGTKYDLTMRIDCPNLGLPFV